MDSSLNLYLSVSRLIFSSENLNLTEFESNFTKLYQSLTCFACGKLLIEAQSPNSPGNCKHYLCLDCLNKRINVSKSDCRLCSDYARNPQLQLVLKCFKELCEYIKISSVYSMIEKHFEEDSESFGTLDDNQVKNLMQLIEQGAKYGKVDITTPIDSKIATAAVLAPYNQTFPFIPPLSPVTAALPFNSPLQQVVISTTVNSSPTYSTDLQSSIPSLPVLQNHPPILFQQSVPPPPSIPKLSSSHDFISFSTSSPASAIYTSSPITTKMPTVAPLKMTIPVPTVKVSKSNDNSHSPTIYSVLYAETGNKITLKRQTPDYDDDNSHMKEQKSNIITIKRENNNSTVTFKKPNQVPTPVQSPQQPSSGSSPESNNQSSSNKLKRRGCRCGNATATPGKLTCCGQRCPCYVDSKACIDCKCRGCRNPHYVDGLKKMRHHVPDHVSLQQQQQSFLASLTNQMPVSKPDDLVRMLDKSPSNSSTIITKNSLYNVNGSNGQYQQLRQIPQKTMLKDAVKTMSPIVFPSSTVLQQQPSTSIGFPKTSSPGIQIVYSPMGQKMYMKTEGMQTSAISLHTTTSTITAPTSKMTLNPHMYANSLILNSNQIQQTKSIPQQTYYLDDTKKYIMIKQENYEDSSEMEENLVDQKDGIMEDI